MAGQYPYEKIGLFYLGRELDIHSGHPSPRPLLFKNRSLTTHGCIIGMTGSGKTGLGIALIEEAIMDNVPSIIIDPKGDMGNLLLTFPACEASDFAPWVDPAEAARKGLTIEQFAAETAQTWKTGLESWGQGLDRIGSLRGKTDMTIYTPGSNAGVPVSVLSSFRAPSQEVLADTDTLNSIVNATASSVLALVDISAAPLQSREHILLSSLLLHFWRLGQDLTMETLIGSIVSPPFETVGVFPLDTYYPQPQRMTLAMALNNVIASPTFSSWASGMPLDIQRILYAGDGRPRTAIFSIAHLSESERMFFVTTLLNQVVGWMRRQPGAASLKTLLYMDEIFGYFPPSANPPSKNPMMLLLKQARAYGIGVILATQNPVDLDYKGLSNIGSWFVGRLQTRQDQDRVVAGIVGASAGALDAGKVQHLLAGMKGRRFLLTSAHLDEPVLFETRWVMSYLKGPMSKNDIKRLAPGPGKEQEAKTVDNEVSLP
ncbi:MAG: ATP-binding protein, partial [Desulforhopalus sp.]